MTEMERDVVGRAAHLAWKGWIIGQGYADHPWVDGILQMLQGDADVARWFNCVRNCGIAKSFHHPDMVSWDDLSEEKRGKYTETGMAGYRLGLERGQDD